MGLSKPPDTDIDVKRRIRPMEDQGDGWAMATPPRVGPSPPRLALPETWAPPLGGLTPSDIIPQSEPWIWDNDGPIETSPLTSYPLPLSNPSMQHDSPSAALSYTRPPFALGTGYRSLPTLYGIPVSSVAPVPTPAAWMDGTLTSGPPDSEALSGTWKKLRRVGRNLRDLVIG